MLALLAPELGQLFLEQVFRNGVFGATVFAADSHERPSPLLVRLLILAGRNF